MEANPTIVLAIKGVILHRGRVLIVQRTANDVGGGTWECPGGKLDFGEDLQSGLKREIKEEAGLDVEVGRLLFASTFLTHSTRQVVILTYLCSSNQADVRLSEEHDAFHWAELEELPNYLQPGILADFNRNHVFAVLKEEAERD